MNKKIIILVKLFLLLSLIFSSIFLFNYSYFKGNDGMFLLDALDAVGAKPHSYISPGPFYFSIDSIEWVFFAPPAWRKAGFYQFGVLECSYQYKTPYTDPVYFNNGKRESCWVDFWYLNLEDCPSHPGGKPFFRSNSAIVFYYVLTPDDYKIIDIFQNTKRIPYLKSIALQIKSMPFFLESELNYIKTDQHILSEIPVLVLVVLFSIPYLFIQVIVPPSLSIPFFWLWVVFSVFYIVTPYSALKNIGERIKEVSKKKKDKN